MDNYERNEAALSSLDAWITREPEELPCRHGNAKWNDDETVLYCHDCHEELAIVTTEPCEDCEDGTAVVCIDDMCAGSDTCIHGDGYAPCQRCGGSGYIESRENLTA